MFFKLLLAFSPWLAFLFIASGGLFRLKLGLAVGLVLCVVMGITRLHRGVILWVGLLFFSSALLAVAGFNSMWTAKHMGDNGQRGNGCRHLAIHYYQETVYHGLRAGAYRSVALEESAVYTDEYYHNRSLGTDFHAQRHSSLGQDGAICLVRTGLRDYHLCRACRNGVLFELVPGSCSSRRRTGLQSMRLDMLLEKFTLKRGKNLHFTVIHYSFTFRHSNTWSRKRSIRMESGNTE